MGPSSWGFYLFTSLDVTVKTDNIGSRFHIVAVLPSVLLFRRAVIYRFACARTYHLTRVGGSQRASLVFSASSVIHRLERLRFELWFHFDWIEKINSHLVRCRGKCTQAKCAHTHGPAADTYETRWRLCVFTLTRVGFLFFITGILQKH